MGGGKGGGGAYPGYTRGTSAEGDAYWNMYPDVEQAGMDPWYHYNQYGRNEGRQWGTPSNPLEDIMKGFAEMMGSMFEEPEPEWAVDAEGNFLVDKEGNKVEKANVAYDEEGNIVYHPITGDWLTPQGYTDMTTGLTRRDQLYGGYLDAAKLATDYIDQQIAEERSTAALYGMKYDFDPEVRTKRTTDYFSSIWSGADQTELEGLMTEWGNPEGFTEWLYLPTGSTASEEPKEEEPATLTFNNKNKKGGPPKAKSLLDEEEPLYGSYLGG